MGCCGLLHLLGDLLCHRSRHQASQNISTTMPLTPPSDFCRAVILPSLTAGSTWSGTSHQTMIYAKRHKDAMSISRRGRMCSAVIPDGPPAAPRRAILTLLHRRSQSRSNSEVGSKLSSHEGTLGAALDRSTLPESSTFQARPHPPKPDDLRASLPK